MKRPPSKSTTSKTFEKEKMRKDWRNSKGAHPIANEEATLGLHSETVKKQARVILMKGSRQKNKVNTILTFQEWSPYSMEHFRTQDSKMNSESLIPKELSRMIGKFHFKLLQAIVKLLQNFWAERLKISIVKLKTKNLLKIVVLWYLFKQNTQEEAHLKRVP